MGFYTKSNYFYLPNKKVVDDLIERDGAPTEESFTPFNGMNYLIEEQMRGPRFSVLGIDVIKETLPELSLSKLKGREDASSEDDLSLIDSYSYHLEDIDESYIVKFLRSQLIGLKVNKSDARNVIEENQRVQALMYDTETSKVYNPSDDYVSDEFEESFEATLEIKKKIPYLLKKLQDGSIKYGVSLLSLFIARDGVIQKRDKRNGDIKPRDLLAYPIYAVSGTGELLGTLDPETANNTQKFIAPKNLVLGVNPSDPYYRAGIELTAKARQLGYNLYEEDVRDYSPAYINRLMCSYILSNQEVLLDMGSYDSNIMRLFKDGTLFKVPAQKEANPRSISKVLKLREMARQKLFIVPELHERCSKDNQYRKFIEPLKLIDQFFKKYKEVNIKSTMEEEGTYDCTLDNGVLCDSSGQPLIFKVDAFVNGMVETTGFNHVYVILTDYGYAIRVDDDLDNITMTDVSSMLLFYETRNRDVFNMKKVGL